MPLTYTFNPGGAEKEQLKYYGREELDLMTTYQLREICLEQKILNGVVRPLDKDELIRQILRFRGKEEHQFITTDSNEGRERLEELLASANLHIKNNSIMGCAKLIAYEGLAIEYFDRYAIGYRPEIANTNALLVSGNKICAIFNIKEFPNDPNQLYITKSKEMPCTESQIRSYSLYCMERPQSDLIYRLYHTDQPLKPEHLEVTAVSVLNFEVRPLIKSMMPLAIDFGTSNTTAGMFFGDAYFEQLEGDPITGFLKRNEVNYVYHLNTEEQSEETPVLPSVVGVTGIDGEDVKFAFGYEANRLFKFSYIDEGFSIFYDLKRWVSDPDRQEEIVDRVGRRRYLPRKEIIKAYLEYIIDCARQRFKCEIKNLHISCPVKQKELFKTLFEEILSKYKLESTMLDEGVAVLYSSISDIIAREKFQNNQTYRALIIDCGGGTTDLSSCRFKIDNQRVSYKIDIRTAYENGDTDFGGNNLTYRIMQVVKISLAQQLGKLDFLSVEELLAPFHSDICRMVDEDNGTQEVYRQLEEEYDRAELVLPTCFKEYEHSSRNDYYMVKNNFYFLFDLAERVKKAFGANGDEMRLGISSIPMQEQGVLWVKADRWKLSYREGNQLVVLKDIPTIYMSVKNIQMLLKADIYGIVRKFINTPYESGELQRVSIMRLTGQSCKIDLFREALKEFIPGKIIESARRSGQRDNAYEMKLSCLNGAVKYLKDKKFGYADVKIAHEQAAYPYMITAFTHTNVETVLIDGLERKKTQGYISRNMADLTLNLFLKDAENRQRYSYSCIVDPKTFFSAEPKDIVEKYKGNILQEDIDNIVEKELKFYVFVDEAKWGFRVVPVFRRNKLLQAGADQFFRFETEAWVTNFFDGTK